MRNALIEALREQLSERFSYSDASLPVDAVLYSGSGRAAWQNYE